MSNPYHKKLKTTKISTKAGAAKKVRRYNPYESRINITETLDETQLLDTPILLAEEIEKWAMVASPQQPPQDK